MTKPKVVSLFSGSGGLDLGFEAAGFEIVLSSDLMPEACETLRQNRPSHLVVGPPNHSGDVTELQSTEILKMTGLRKGQIDVIVGGPPCQPFSTAAAQRFLKGDKKFKRVGFQSEDKGQLVFRYVQLILELRPKCFLIENVPGILTIDQGSGMSKVYEILEEAGYTISTPKVIDAADYGVPQFRKRAFVIGTITKKKFIFPEPTHAKSESLFQKEHVGCATVLADISSSLLNNITREHSEASLERYRTLLFGQREMLGRVDRLDPVRPSKTVIAGGTNGGGRSHLHPYQARTLTVRECARLQTYPDDYIFHGSIARQFTLVGNSVPPLIAEILARCIGKQYFGKSYPKVLKFQINKNNIASSKALAKLSKKSHPEWNYTKDSYPSSISST
jgi:DNA (cytosine-5)-methyltransferase 1